MGCVIFELCTGKRPFEANNQAALALKILMGKYDNIPSHYSQDLTWFVKSCLSVDYKRRPSAAYLLQMPSNFIFNIETK
jgi:NIMA (never in mitosis gene a)-related kinase